MPDSLSRCEICGGFVYSVPTFPPTSWIAGAVAGAVFAGALAAVLALTATKPPDHPSAAYQAAFSAQRWVAPPTPPSASATASGQPIEVEIAGPQVDGMDRDEAIQTLRKQDKAIRACALPPGSAAPSAELPQGIRVRIEVRADGTVQDIEVMEQEPPDERVAECARKVIRKIRFKRPGAPATVVTAWSFVEDANPAP